MAEEDVVRGRTGEFPGEMLLLPSAAALPKCLVCTRRTTVSSGCADRLAMSFLAATKLARPRIFFMFRFKWFCCKKRCALGHAHESSHSSLPLSCIIIACLRAIVAYL